ncbi:hypothetical protein CDAR_227301 [Caerostris darwini]|uniref:Uncharacterized protein n=1 Tax=Caerostris darwini TaxID=1538125 RepID=A0AAV4UM44_9ARAC|nr:hypothetical protein CDAR_227301 [Caerostris darwini]
MVISQFWGVSNLFKANSLSHYKTNADDFLKQQNTSRGNRDKNFFWQPSCCNHGHPPITAHHKSMAGRVGGSKNFLIWNRIVIALTSDDTLVRRGWSLHHCGGVWETYRHSFCSSFVFSGLLAWKNYPWVTLYVLHSGSLSDIVQTILCQGEEGLSGVKDTSQLMSCKDDYRFVGLISGVVEDFLWYLAMVIMLGRFFLVD